MEELKQREDENTRPPIRELSNVAELKRLDLRKSDLYVESICNYYDLMARTKDTADFVPEKYNKKIAKLFFKEFIIEKPLRLCS